MYVFACPASDPSPVLSAEFCKIVDKSFPWMAPVPTDAKALDNISGTPASVNPPNTPPVMPPYNAPFNAALSGSPPWIAAIVPLERPPTNAPFPAVANADCNEVINGDVKPSESAASTAPLVSPTPVPPAVPTVAPVSPAISSGSKSIAPAVITVSAIAPIMAHPPGIVSLTNLSTDAPILPIAGPGSIAANALPNPLPISSTKLNKPIIYFL